MNLTQRLRTIARHVPKNSICGDIGTDHGYIPIYLVRNRICKKVIATDINEDPIKIAREQIKAAGLEGQIQTRLGDGLKPLSLIHILKGNIVIGGASYEGTG